MSLLGFPAFASPLCLLSVDLVDQHEESLLRRSRLGVGLVLVHRGQFCEQACVQRRKSRHGCFHLGFITRFLRRGPARISRIEVREIRIMSFGSHTPHYFRFVTDERDGFLFCKTRDDSEGGRADAVFSASVRVGAHLLRMNGETRNLRLTVTRRDEPDLGKLIEWVLGIAEARHRAWLNGDPDPYGLPPPDDLPPTRR